MAAPERDVYTSDGTTDRTIYTRESNATGWFVGIIVALALIAIGYLVFSANSGPSTTSTTVNNTPITEPATPAPVVPDTTTTPMTTTAPAPDTSVTPMTTTPSTPAPTAPSDNTTTTTPPANDTTTTPTTPAPATPAPATPATPAQ